MLNLKPKQPTRVVTHTESGAKFELRTLSPSKREAMRRRHLKGEQLQLVDYMKEAADYTIVSWWDVGDGSETAECTKENRALFGANFATSIMPWLLGEAESLDAYISEEVSEAKNG